MDPDPTNECDLDVTIESKCHYKLRSSLKKAKSRNPLGSLDITELTADLTLAIPPRRVSFAASNYVKPFIDDPEKNTIWDNTYEEEVNHTDSTKSENTNHTNLSELKSHCQEITNLNTHQSNLSDKDIVTNVYCDQNVVDMEVSCFDKTIVNEDVINSLCESNSDIAPIRDVKNSDVLDVKDGPSFNMELTCQWTNNIIQSSNVLQKEVITKRDYLVRNSTVHQEEDMSMTCCFENLENQENRLLPAGFAENSNVGKKEISFRSPLDYQMEVGKSFSNRILESNNQPNQIKYEAIGIAAVTENVENKENILSIDHPIRSSRVGAKKENSFFPEQSEMDFTCTFSRKILETANGSKETANYSIAQTAVGARVENKEPVLPDNQAEYFPTVDAKKERLSLSDQSAMEFTCAFSNKIIEKASHNRTTSNSLIMSEKVENKENIFLPAETGCAQAVFAKREKEFLPNQSEMELTCVAKSDKEFLPDQSEMEFTCKFPNNILETVNHFKGATSKMFTMTSVNEKVDEKENALIDLAEFPTFSNQPKQIKTNFETVPVTTENVENKENIFAGLTTIDNKTDKNLSSRQGEMEFTCSYPEKIFETANHLTETVTDIVNKENNILPVVECCSTVYDKKNKVFSEISEKLIGIGSHFKETESSVFLQTKESKPKMEIVSKFNDNQCSISSEVRSLRNEQSNSNRMEITNIVYEPSNNLTMNRSILSRDKLNNEQSLTSEDIYNTNNLYTVGNQNNCKFKSHLNVGSSFSISQYNPPPDVTKITVLKNLENKHMESISGKHNVGTEIIKPVKVREFGNIPVAMDTTDVSIDQDFNDHIKSMSVTSKQDFNLGKNACTLSVTESDRNLLKLKQETSVGQKVNKSTANKSHNVDPQNDLISFRETGETIGFKSGIAHGICTQTSNSKAMLPDQNIDLGVSPKRKQLKLQGTSFASGVCTQTLSPAVMLWDQNTDLAVSPKQNQLKLQGTSFTSNVKPIFLKKHACKELAVELSDECKEFTKNIVDKQLSLVGNQIENISVNEGGTTKDKINNSLDIAGAESIAEECTLIESLEESILINSINILEDEPQKHLGTNFSQTGVQHNESEKDRKKNIKEDLQLEQQIAVTKVIYSEPMKVGPFQDDFPSMQSSGMNPFNFSSIGMEDTQQLIQTTFSKPTVAKTDQLENNKWHSRFLPDSNMLEVSEKSELNVTPTVQNKTLTAELILKNVGKKIVRSKFSSINYEEIADSIKTLKEFSNNMEKLLCNYRFPEICSFSLQEKTKKLSLPNISSDGNSSDSLLDVLESAEDNNCNKSMLLEPTRSLHEKIVDVCTRSKKLLSINYVQETFYIFSTMYECLLIYVEVHPEDGRVVEIKTASSLDDSADLLNHFLVKNVMRRLKDSTLKSYLGPYYDVLSLLDHICLTVDEVTDFHYEILSLQKLYPSLRIHSDCSITFEILHNCPPIWWTIKLDMTSVNKINPDSLKVASKWGIINDEHIKQILRNIDEGVDSLRSFISDVLKYFDRTQLKLIKQS